MASRYDSTRGGSARGTRYADVLAPRLNPAEPVLDVGAGTGVVGEALGQRGFGVIGIDLSFDMLALARGRMAASVVADAARLPFGPGTIRQAYSVWVLQMTADAATTLAEVARVLAPGGCYAVVSGVLAPADDDIGRLYDSIWERIDPDGRRDDRRERLRELAPGAGLTVEEALPLPPTYHDQSPLEAAEFVESRAPFCLWALDAARWKAEIVPVVDALRALPDPDRRRHRRTVRDLTVLKRDR
ncbi:class I SAM-dependent methyltransferase [Streptomyces sp. NPDC060022]|uniref:class I SAM-dependent methyltransferase n=1 Tax=Streptomyces sp. NPDC060022 TaxID=3347039 RepID=UPI00368810A5